MSTNLIATIQSIKDHQLAKIINLACFPFSLATNLLTNHGEIQEQITRNCINHHSISKSNRNQSIQYYQTQIQENQASSKKNQIASK